MRRARNEEWRTKYGSLYRKYVGRLIIRRGGKRDREREREFLPLESTWPPPSSLQSTPRRSNHRGGHGSFILVSISSTSTRRFSSRGRRCLLSSSPLSFFRLSRCSDYCDRKRERKDGWLSLRGGLFIENGGSSVSRIHV